MPEPKPLWFTKHAGDVILERKIARSWVEKAALMPDWSQPDPKRPSIELRFLSVAEYGGRVLRAVCAESDDEIRILTVFFDQNARRPE